MHPSNVDTDEVFHNLAKLVTAECEIASVEPRTAESTVDDERGYESPSEESSCAEPGEDSQATEEVSGSAPGASAAEDDTMGNKKKHPILKGKYAKLAADARQAADAAAAAARAQERAERAKAARSAKGKAGPGPSKGQAKNPPTPPPPPADVPVASASTSAADPESASASGSTSAPAPSEDSDDPDPSNIALPAETRSHRRNPLPYTFNNIHGDNIKLCSSGKLSLYTI